MSDVAGTGDPLEDPTQISSWRELRLLQAAMDAEIERIYVEDQIYGLKPTWVMELLRLHFRGPMTITELAESGSSAVVLVPVGFISDHMEVVFDLDVEAARYAERLGLPLARAATPSTDPRFAAMVTELVSERQDGLPPRALGKLGPVRGVCGGGCGGAGATRPRMPA